MEKHFDIVIVGSGAGGATVADRLSPLAEKGAKIALLEAGPHYPRSYFTQREIEMMGLFWHGGGWPTEDGGITLAAGKGVGGSTLVYTGVTFRLPDDVCRDWGVEGLTPEDLKPRFEALEEELSVITPGPEYVNENNALFKEACEKLGWPVETIRLNIKDCEQMGFCNLGCASGGKQGALEVQIPRALKAGVSLAPNCSVEKVSGKSLSVRVDQAPEGTLPGPWEPGPATITADTIVLAAGSPSTPGLLLRSGLGGELPALGTQVTMHPALTLYGVYPRPIKNYRGFPKTFYTPKFSASDGYYMETAFYYPFVSTKHLGLWGDDLKSVMRDYARFMTVIILNHDDAIQENRVKVKGPETLIRYKISEATKKSLVHAQKSAARLFFAAGCEKAVMPCAKPMILTPKDADRLDSLISEKNFIVNKMPLSSAHPQGGCRMGKSPADSVTDAHGAVHGRPGLYVADASLFPKSSHVNPYLTVMALADRVAEGIKKNFE